jgi:hypothetical protein
MDFWPTVRVVTPVINDVMTKNVDYGFKLSLHPSSIIYLPEILGKLARPQFPHLNNGYNNSSLIKLWEWNVIDNHC